MIAVKPEIFLKKLFNIAISAVNPENFMTAHLPKKPRGKTVIIAAGKAAASMTRAIEQVWQGPLSGLGITRYGHNISAGKIEIIEAGHPLPDEAGLNAGRRSLQIARELRKDDLLLFLLSGGASALLVEPIAGLALQQKKLITENLLRSGAPIDEINCVRKHLSAIKGGRLAAAAFPARVLTIAISDVVGDNPETIGSGPTVGDSTTCADALAVTENRNILISPYVKMALKRGDWESLSPKDKRLQKNEYIIAARPTDAQVAAYNHGIKLGLAVELLGHNLEGESRTLANEHARIAKQSGPRLLLSGGETTVTLKGKLGRGGPNMEYLLALAIALNGAANIYSIAGDTDGIDGTEDAAGAIITPTTLNRAKKAGLDAKKMLNEHDSYSFFKKLGDLLITGPTRTNVNDFRAIYITGS